MWRNWQTRTVQVRVGETPWRFESSHPHHENGPASGTQRAFAAGRSGKRARHESTSRSRRVARGVPVEAQQGAHARAFRPRPKAAWRAQVRGAQARGQQAALRLTAGGGRGAEVVGGAEGTVDRSPRETARHGGGGPSARLRRLWGGGPGGGGRGGLGDRLGRRAVPQPDRARRRGAADR